MANEAMSVAEYTSPAPSVPMPTGFGPPSGGLSIAQIWRIFLRRRWILISVFSITVLAAIVYVLMATRMYEGSATVDIYPQSSSTGDLENLIDDKLGGEEVDTKMQTEMHIMQSASVLTEVAQTLDLAHKRPFVLLLRKDPVPSGSRTFTPAQKAAIVSEMIADSTFLLQPGTSIVQISFRSPDPQLAKEVPNAIVDTYIGKDLGSSFQGTARVATWLNAQMEDLRSQVQQAQQNLAKFQQQNNIIGIDESQNILVDKLRLTNEQLVSVEADRIAKEANYRIAQTNDPELISSIAGNPTLQILRGQDIDLKVQYNDAASRYGRNYPHVRELKDQLDAMQNSINAEIARTRERFRLDYEAAKKGEDAIHADLDAQKAAIYNLNKNAAQFAMLRHDAEATRSLYDAIQYKLKETGIMQTLKSTQFRIIDQADVPVIPVSPRVGVILASGMLVGLFLGCVLAIIVDFVDDAIYSAADLERITGLPIIGAIPHFDIKTTTNSVGGRTAAGDASKIAPTPFLFVLAEPLSPTAEAFRGLRAAMRLGFVDRSPQVQVITSASAAEGKSLISCNYAITLAQRGAKVLLVDCDVRRGTIHTKFRISSKPGLTSILSKLNSVEDIRNPIPSLPNLFVLPNGPTPPNPSELLDSERMVSLLQTWRATYDYIIIDSAPLIPVADTFPLATRADLVLLVVRAAATRKKGVIRVQEMLRRANAPVGGLIMNDVGRSLDEYYSYYGSYGYYGAITTTDETGY